MRTLAAAEAGLRIGEAWPLGLLFLGVAVFAAIGALSHEHERAFSASLIYLGLGVLGAAGLAVTGANWLDPVADAHVLERITELAIVVALFSAGLKVERALAWREWGSVARLLALAMPLTIGLVALFGGLVMGLSVGAALVLGAVLSPTDPVLAGDIGIGPPGEEDEHEPHFAITAEAGFNDGLAFPFVLLGLAVAERGSAVHWALADVLYPIGIGIPVGAGLGWAMAWSVVRLRDRELLTPSLDGWVAVAATLTLFGAAETVGANGFIAVFAGALAFRRYERDHEVNHRVHLGAEVVEKFGELAVVILLGSMLTLDGLGAPGLAGWGLAVLLAVLLRPLAVNVAMAGSRLVRPGERAFVAWFGVRGVGTLYYAAAVAAGGGLAAGESRTVVWTAIACVVVSIAVHGVTAGPLNRWLHVNVLERDRDAVPV